MRAAGLVNFFTKPGILTGGAGGQKLRPGVWTVIRPALRLLTGRNGQEAPKIPARWFDESAAGQRRPGRSGGWRELYAHRRPRPARWHRLRGRPLAGDLALVPAGRVDAGRDRWFL